MAKKSKSSTVVEIYQDEGGGWRWREIAQNGKIVSDCGEGYATKSSVKRAARTRFPGKAMTEG